MTEIKIPQELMDGRTVTLIFSEVEQGTAPVRRVIIHQGLEARVLDFDDLPPWEEGTPTPQRYQAKFVLRIRAGAGLDQTVIDSVSKGHFFDVNETQIQDGYVWGKLADEPGWVATGTTTDPESLALKVD